MNENNDYLNFQVIDPNSGLTNRKDHKTFKVLEGSSDSRYEPVNYVGDLIDGKSRYDTNLTEEDLANVERERALKQPGSTKAFNAIVGGVASGVMTAVQDVGYLFDVENNVKRLLDLDTVHENWIGQLMREGKEELGKAMPIYRQSQEVFDWDDPGFYWSAVKGIIDSAVGFGLPGLGAAKAVNAGMKALKLTELFRMSKPVAQVVNSVGAGYLTNFMEGKTMAVEQFENSVQAMTQNLTNTNFEKLKKLNPDLPTDQLYNMAVDQTNQELASGKQKEFETIAGEEANRFMTRNKAFILTDAIGLHGLYKGKGFTSNILKAKGIKEWGKSFGKLSEENMILQGGKEYLEEVGQNVMQKEGEYQSEKKAGIDVSDTPENLGKRIYEFATSDQAQLEGLMGFFGGGPQRIMMEVLSGNFGAKAKAEYKKKYDEQQNLIKENTDFLNTKLGNYAKAQSLRNEAIANGMDNYEEVVKNSTFLGIVGRNFALQTTENLRRQLEDITKGVSEEERLAHGWEENYKQQAMEQLSELNRMEKEYLNYTKYENQLDVFINRQQRQIIEKDQQAIKLNIDQLHLDLEFQDNKDPDKVERKKRLEKDYELATQKIDELDTDFKNLISKETQKSLVQKRKEAAKQARQRVKQVVDATKKADAAIKAAKRKDTIATKEAAAETVSASKVSAQDDKAPKVSSLVDTDDKKTPSVKDLGNMGDQDVPVTNLGTQGDQDLNPRQAEHEAEIKTHADKLLQELENITTAAPAAGVVTGVFEVAEEDDSLADDAIGPNALSKESVQKRVGILYDMIESVRKTSSTGEVSFDDVMKYLLKFYGKERIAPIFGAIEGLYYQLDNSHVYKNTLDEYLNLTPSEKNEAEAAKHAAQLLAKEQFTAYTEQEIQASLDQIEKIISQRNSGATKEQDAMFDYLRVAFAGNIVAYLSRNYQQSRVGSVLKKEEISNILNEQMQDKKILDPDLYKPGTEIVLRLEDVNETPDYVRGVENKSVSTWGANKDVWKIQLKQGLKTQAEYDQLYAENVPIAIYAGDQKIGYIHTTEWIKPSNVLEEGIEESRRVNIAIRKHVVANKEFRTKITERTSGYLFRASKGPVPTAEAYPDTKLQYAVVKNGSLHTSREDMFNPEKPLLNSKALREGATYVIVEVPDGTIAIPLLHNKIGSNEDVVRSVTRAMQIFYKNDESEEAKSFVDAIYEASGRTINITTALGLSEYIRTFVNLYNIGAAGSMEKFIAENTTPQQNGDVFVTTFVRDTDNDLQFEIAIGGMNRSIRRLSKAALKEIGEAKFNEYLNQAMQHLRLAYFQTNLDSVNTEVHTALIDKDGNHYPVAYMDFLRQSTKSAFLSHNIADPGQPAKYVYTIQPVISFDYSSVPETETVVQSKDTEPVKDPENVVQTKVVIESQEEVKLQPKKVDYEDLPEGFERDDAPEELADNSFVGLSEDEIEQIRKDSEVKIDAKGNVSGVIIKDFDKDRQDEVVDYLVKKVSERVFGSEKKISRQEAFDNQKKVIDTIAEIEKRNFAKAIEAQDDEKIAYFERQVAKFTQIHDNWKLLASIANDYLIALDLLKVVNDDDNADKTSIEQQEEKEVKGNEGWIDQSYEKDPSVRLSGVVKEFLSGITMYENNTPKTRKVQKDDGTIEEVVVNKYGTPRRTYFGTERSMSFQDVYNILQRLTPNMPSTYDKVVSELKKHTEAYPFIGEVLEKLEKSSEQTRIQFVTAMTNHYVGMEFIMFGVNKKTGAFELTKFDSDANELKRVILYNWNQQLMLNSAVRSEDADQVIIPQEVRDLIKARYEKWKTENKFPPNEVREWLHRYFGMEFNDKAWTELVNGKFWTGGRKWSFRDLMLHKFGKFLYENISTRGAAALIDKPVFEGTVFDDLAKLEARFTRSTYTNSHRSGTKTIYSYSHNKFLVNRLRELKERDEDGYSKLIDDLGSLSFNGESAWIDAMYSEDEDENAKFLENFDYWILSLEALKKKGAKSRDNAELHNLSAAEIEMVKIGMLQAAREDRAGKNQRIINLLYPTTSDKTTVLGLRVVAQELKLQKETGRITNESVERLIKYVVMPEVRRIMNYQKLPKERRADVEGYDGGAQMFLLFPELNTIDGLFIGEDRILSEDVYEMMEPEGAVFNKVKEYFENLVDQKLANWKEDGLGVTDKETGALIGLNSKFINGTQNRKYNPLGASIDNPARIRAAAADMVFQYLIGNAEVAKLFTGDPAIYYKQAGVNSNKSTSDAAYDFVADAKETYINIGKRLAADIAPGVELADSENNTYLQAFGADFSAKSPVRFDIAKMLDGEQGEKELRELEKKLEKKEISKKQFAKAVKKYNSGAYFNFKSTDAQELTTWREHLYVMKQLGELSDQDYNDAYFLLSTGQKLSEHLHGLIMQPMKPVYVDNITDTNSDVERRIYIKSSSFPLLPYLTQGTQLDNLRIAMENNNISRFAFATAVKVGNFKEPLNIFDDEGNILKAEKISFKGKTMQLNRKGFRIQQSIPVSRKTEINKLTQASKNLLVNMLDVDGFKLWWHNDGNPIKGSELQKVYHEQYDKLHKLEKDRLLKRLTYPNGAINREELRKLLREEVKQRGYPISDRELLELDKQLSFVTFSPSSNKFESLMNSIVANRIIKIHMPGKSYVLGSQEGFKGVKVEGKKAIAKRTGIIYTKDYDPEQGLLPQRIGKNGEILPSQAIVPWKFKDQSGNIIDMKKYIDPKTNLLDTSKMPKQILTLFGMRIPNQGPNSQGRVQIVGFLPKESGDLIIATRDFVVQMGSDFDVDKLYTYMYYLYVDKDNNIKLEERDEEKLLKNKIIDIHHAIHSNPDPRVQSQIANPIGTWILEDKAKEFAQMREKRESGKGNTQKKMFTGLSDQYQREKFKNASMGKSGVGVFSLDSTFNCVAQGKDLVLMEKDMMGQKSPVSITIGNKTSNGKLSDVYALDKKTYKSDVIAGYQSAAVDNEKLQILDKLNINNHTFKAIKVLNQLGFGEETLLYISQDIVMDYVKELERLGSSLSGYVANRAETARENVLKMPKYQLRQGESADPELTNKLATSEATIENLTSYIEKGENASNYRLAQRAILDQFIYFDALGQKIQEVQSAINPDSSGIGKSLMESQLKEDQVFRLLGSEIENAHRLVGDMGILGDRKQEDLPKGYITRTWNGEKYYIKPETINGFAIVHGLFTNNDLWSDFFPYRMDEIQMIFSDIEKIAGQDTKTISNKADRRKEIWNEFKSFLFTKRELGLYDTTTNQERDRILYDKYVIEKTVEDGKTISKPVHTHLSLASIISRLKQTPFGQTGMLAMLQTDVKINGEPSLLKFNAASAEGADEGRIYASLVNMLVKKDASGNSPVVGAFNGREYTARDIAQELILYTYLTGGLQEAVQFVKYVPAAYLHTIPFFRVLSDFRSLESEYTIVRPEDPKLAYYTIQPFVQQFFQHNPEKLPQIGREDIVVNNPDLKKLKNVDFFDIVTEFELSKEALKKIGVMIDSKGGPSEPVFVTVRSNTSTSGLNLFRFDPKSGTYKKLDTLGSFGNSEYDYHALHQTSLIKGNRTRIINISSTAPVQKKAPVVSEQPKALPVSIIDDIASEKTKNLVKKDGKQAVKEILNDIIIGTQNPYHKVLAEELLKRVDYLPDGMTLKVAQNGADKAAGTFFYIPSEERKEDGNTLYLNYDKLQSKSRDYIANVFIHELIHGLTGYKITMFLLDGKTDAKSIAQLKQLKTVAPNLVLTDQDREVLKSLNTLYNQVVAKLKSDDVFLAGYNDYLKKLGMSPQQRVISTDELSKYYGIKNLKEFVTMALTDKGFQDLLNNTKLDNGKTFWQAFKERIIKLLQNMGFDVKPGNALEESLHQILNVLDIQKPQTSVPVETNLTPADYVNHSGGAYGGDTFWDQIGREYGVVNHRHYREGNNLSLSKQLRDKGITATVLSKEQMDKARAELKRLLGKDFPDTLQGNLQVRNYYQVINSDAVFAVAKLNGDAKFNAGSVFGGTNTAVQLGIKLQKPVYLWNIDSEQWMIYTPIVKDGRDIGEFRPTDTPVLTKNFAGVGSRDIEGYNVLDKTDNKWKPRKEYVGKEKEEKAKRAIRDVYIKTFGTVNQSKVETSVNKVTVESRQITDRDRLTLPNGKVITFNDEQRTALDNMENWFKSDEMFFTLSGFAGTGKTTIVKKMLETFLNRYPIVVSAPTHVAKRVIGEATKREAMTLHSLLGLKPDVDLADFDPDNPEFAPVSEPGMKGLKVVIVDESSMLNKALLKMLMREAKSNRVKLLFMGDQAQIPPVGEKISEVFTHPEIKSMSHLSKVERQADSNPLFSLYDAIRNDITSSTDRFTHETKLNDKGEGVLFTSDPQEFTKKLLESFTSQEFKDNPGAFKMISWTNAGVGEWNKIIRTAVMGDKASFIEQGDLLTGYKTVTRNRSEVLFENSGDYKVVNKGPKKVNSYGIEGYDVVIQNMFNEKTRIFIVDRTSANLTKYLNKVEELRQMGMKYKGAAWASFYRFKEDNILLGDIYDSRGKKLAPKQLDYGYASTIHKVQGRTVKTIFIDENNIDQNQFSSKRHVAERVAKKLEPLTKTDIDTERNKIKYVALSRPTQNAVVLSSKTLQSTNSYVQPAKPKLPVTDVAEPNVTTLPESDEEGVDLAALMREVEAAADQEEVPPARSTEPGEDIEGIDFGSIFDSYPDEKKNIVSDKEVEEFMKHCKGL